MTKIVYIVLLLISLLSIAGCSTKKGGEDRSMRVLMVVPPEEIMDVEYEEVRKVFDQKGLAVQVASTIKGKVTGASLENNSDLLISEADAGNYDAIVLIGGMGIFKHILGNEELQKLVKVMHKNGKYVTAICGASVVLAKAGILKGVKATCYPDAGLVTQMQEGGALYSKDETVVSGKIITGNGPGASVSFAKLLGEAFVL